ncbi:hypothetical protein EGW08_009438 [Elysia chlorotica]|uniref:Uncharacterized protein n=1 Tax=Elysia chlorotica TaxID=188477 RepID=A0A3S1A4Y5_ELYCH|nr:hypothetical protein EGW08_009438 [Elysia chlorotica]
MTPRALTTFRSCSEVCSCLPAGDATCCSTCPASAKGSPTFKTWRWRRLRRLRTLSFTSWPDRWGLALRSLPWRTQCVRCKARCSRLNVKYRRCNRNGVIDNV